MADDAGAEEATAPSPADIAARVSNRRFTQAEVDQIVQERLRRSRPADYEEVARTAEAVDEMERLLAEKEQALTHARFEVRRNELALQHRVPSDLRDEFMTAMDEATLALQAQRLSALTATRHVGGNVAPREGKHVENYRDPQEREMREIVNHLFQNDVF